MRPFGMNLIASAKPLGRQRRLHKRPNRPALARIAGQLEELASFAEASVRSCKYPAGNGAPLGH